MLFLSFALIIALFILSIKSRSDIDSLRKELQLIRARFEKLEQSVNSRLASLDKQQAETSPTNIASGLPGTKVSEAPTREAKPIIVTPPPTGSPTVTFTPKAHSQNVVVQPAPRRTSAEWEALIGGKVLNRIGAFAIVLATVYFLKLAIDNNWISETVRIFIGVVAGAALIGFAERQRTRGYAIFSQGLLAAGIAIEYFTVYAAHDFYNLIPISIELFALCCVTVIALFFAILFDSIAVVYLGWAGGFLTPFVLHLHNENPLGSFIYLIIFSTSLLLLIRKKPGWWPLELFAKGGTFLGYFILYGHTFEASTKNYFVLFVIIVWAIYQLYDLFRQSDSRLPDTSTRFTIQSINALFVMTAIIQILYPDNRVGASFIYFVIACGYAFSAVYVSPAFDETSIVWRSYAVGTILFLTAGLAIIFEGFIGVTILAVEAAAVFVISSRNARKTTAYIALCVLSFTILRYFITDNAFYWKPISDFTLLLNFRTLTLLILTGTMITMLIVNKKSGNLIRWDLMRFVAIGVGVTLFTWVTIETIDGFDQKISYLTIPSSDRVWWVNIKQLTLSGVWLAFSTIAMVIGLWKRMRGIRIAAISVFGVTILKIFIIDLSFLTTIYRVISFLGLGVILLVISFLYQKYKYLIIPLPEKEEATVINGE